jgi:hypothetical protein
MVIFLVTDWLIPRIALLNVGRLFLDDYLFVSIIIIINKVIIKVINLM